MTAAEANHLRRNSIGTAHIVFFVVAAAAPLTAVLGASPAAFAYGNGAGVPAVYVLVGLLYVVFSAGFTAMSPFVQGANGFYAYALRGFGVPAGGMVAAIAIASYQAIAVGAYGLFGFFASEAAAGAGLHLNWFIAIIPLLALVHICGRRAVTFAGNLLAVCMIGEIAILLALCVAILLHNTTPLAQTMPADAILAPGLGVAIVFVVASFIGFEATVIFGEEAREPARTIPKATYISVILIASFYGLCTWCASIYYGPAAVGPAAARDPGNLYFIPIGALLGSSARSITQGLLLTSLFACVLSFHATIARYLASIAEEGMAARRLARIHAKHGSPYVAGWVQTVATAAMLGVGAMAGIDPFAGLFAWAGSFASLGVLAIQVLTSAAVLAFFRKAPQTASFATGTVAPLISGAGLTVCLVLAVINLPLIAGSESRSVFLLPVGVAVAALCGWIAGKAKKEREDHGASDKRRAIP